MSQSRSSVIRLGLPAVLAALLAVAFLFDLGLWMNPTYPVDDAYVSFRYAQNWAAGRGIVFNPGERVEGYSNFLWMALIALAAKLELTPPLAARLLALASVGAMAGSLVVAPRRWVPEVDSTPRTSWVAGGLAAGLFLLSPYTMWNVLSGLEAPLFASLLVGALWLLETRRRYLVPVVCLLLTLTRPEGLVLAAIVFAADLLRPPRSGTLGGAAFPATRRGRTVGWLLIFAVPYAAYTLWRWSCFGALLPNSLQVKAGIEHQTLLVESARYVGGFLSVQWPLIGFAAIAFLAPAWRWRHRLAAPFAALVALFALNLILGAGDPYTPLARYLYPALPLAALVAASGAAVVLRALRGRWSRALVTSVLAAILLLQLSLYLRAGVPRLELRTGEGGRVRQTLHGLGAVFEQDRGPHLDERFAAHLVLHYEADWLRRNSRPTDVLAKAEIGTVPYYTGLRVLDTFGLVNPQVARQPGPPGAKATREYVFDQEPEFISMRVQRECLCRGIPSDEAVRTDWRLRQRYDLVQVYIKEVVVVLLFQKRRVPAFEVHLDLAEEFSSDRVSFFTAEGKYVLEGPDVETLVEARAIAPPQWETLGELLIANRPELPGGTSVDPEFVERMRSWLASWQRLLYHYPYTRDRRPSISYDVTLPRDPVLRFTLISNHEFWAPEFGDGVEYEVAVTDQAGGRQVVFSEYHDPKNRKEDRTWKERTVDLSPWAGRRVRIELVTSPGPADDRSYDYGGWGEPQIRIAAGPVRAASR